MKDIISDEGTTQYLDETFSEVSSRWDKIFQVGQLYKQIKLGTNLCMFLKKCIEVSIDYCSP